MTKKPLTLHESKRIKARQELIKRAIAYLVLTLGALTMIVPFLWMLSTSLKEATSVFSYTFSFIPRPFTFVNYARIWNLPYIPFLRFYFNSIVIAVCVTVGAVGTSSLAAYAFARLKFPARDKLFLAYLATLMVPGSITMVPLFGLMRIMGWMNTYPALIVPAIFTAYGTFMMRQFFMTLPKDLEDAAKMDGCGLFGIFWRIIMPLSKPALATLTTFTFLGNWASFMWPLLVTNTADMKTLPIGLAYFQEMYQQSTMTDWPLLMTGSLLVMLPLIVIFVFNQRFFVEGIKLTGIKG